MLDKKRRPSECFLALCFLPDYFRKHIGKFLYVLTPKEGKTNAKKTKWKGRINAIEEIVEKAIETSKKEMKKNIEQRFEQIKEILTKQQNDQDLLLSIVKEIKASTVDINAPTSSSGSRFTKEEQVQLMHSFLQDDMA